MSNDTRPVNELSVWDVQARVEVIRARAAENDYEEAHGLEDELFFDILRAIAHGAPHPATLAKAALATEEMDFPRYCA